eukprot:gene9477-biopygen12323
MAAWAAAGGMRWEGWRLGETVGEQRRRRAGPSGAGGAPTTGAGTGAGAGVAAASACTRRAGGRMRSRRGCGAETLGGGLRRRPRSWRSPSPGPAAPAARGAGAGAGAGGTIVGCAAGLGRRRRRRLRLWAEVPAEVAATVTGRGASTLRLAWKGRHRRQHLLPAAARAGGAKAGGEYTRVERGRGPRTPRRERWDAPVGGGRTGRERRIAARRRSAATPSRVGGGRSEGEVRGAIGGGGDGRRTWRGPPRERRHTETDRKGREGAAVAAECTAGPSLRSAGRREGPCRRAPAAGAGRRRTSAAAREGKGSRGGRRRGGAGAVLRGRGTRGGGPVGGHLVRPAPAAPGR